MAATSGGELNGLDIIIVFVTLAIIGVAFTQGLVRQLLLLLAIYAALAVSTSTYRQLARQMAEVIPAAGDVLLGAFAFVLIFLATIAITLTLAGMFVQSPLQPQLGAFDNLGGAIVGVGTSYLVLTIMLMILYYMTHNIWPDYNALRISLLEAGEKSQLTTFVAGNAQLVYGTLMPWVPGGVPVAFSFK